MAGKEYTAKDKVFSKMTREGLTEETLREGSVKKIGQKSRDEPELDSKERDEEKVALGKRLSDSSGRTDNRRMRRYVQELKMSSDIETEEKPARTFSKANSERIIENKDSWYQGKLRSQEQISEVSGILDQKDQLKKKRVRKRLTEEQAKSGRLFFGDEGSGMIHGAGNGIGRRITAGAALYARNQIREDGDNNAAVDGSGAVIAAADEAAHSLRRAQLRSQRSDVKAHRKGLNIDAPGASRLKFDAAKEAADRTAGDAVINAEKKRLLNHFFQRKKYKDAYRVARAGKTAGSLGGTTTIAGVENMTVKAKIALKEIVRRNRTVFLVIGIFSLIFMLIAVSLGSCSASIQAGGSLIGMTTYSSTDADIYAAENAYAAMEEALNRQINNMESIYPDYDSYQYNVSEIGHNPYHLTSYLTVKYGGYTYADVRNELQDLFQAQYHLSTHGRTETVTETRTVRVGESLGNVVTSGYCNCSICCGRWSGGATASGVYPTANHTIAVDANNPIVPMGTKVIMNGVEYTVEDTGNFARYGVAFDVYYDSHSVASAHGHQTWEAFLADDNGSREVEVTTTTTQRVLYVTLTNTNFDAVARANLTEEQEILYDALNTTLGNRNYLWDVNRITGAGGGMSYEIPPEALSDERFAKMIREAEKYLGYPYVWGGSSPSTSFDCSGYVSWVVNHCGNGWNYGRRTADGLRALCTYVPPSQAKPGDLIFFQGTYNTSGASHVGIYVGNGMMIHCGDPIQYANINTSYWQQHFMCFGRLP